MKQVVTNSILTYLRKLAKTALSRHNPKIIGVAGSVGKSSTRNATEAILKDYFKVKSIGNSETGIPLGILGITPKGYTKKDWALMLTKAPFGINFLKGTEYLIVEMGIDEPDPPKNMEYLLTILKPDIAIDLNASATHSMQFDKTIKSVKKPSLETDEQYSSGERSEKAEVRLNKVVKNIAKEDSKIITQSDCKVGIYNNDDEHLHEIFENYFSSESQTESGGSQNSLQKPTPLTFGAKNKNNVSYGIYSVDLEGSNFQLFIEENGKNTETKLKFKDFIMPEVYREVFAASILAGLQTGLTLEQIKRSLQKNYKLPNGRSSLLKGVNGSVIIDSSYNASKKSVLAFLDLLDRLENKTDRDTVFVFGDMRELGKESKIEHEEVARRIVGTVDYLYLVGPQTMEYVLPIVQTQDSKFKEIRWFDRSTRVGDYLKDNMPGEAICLFKGSQNTIFLEEGVKKVLENKSDISKLCRQSDFWMKIKRSS